MVDWRYFCEELVAVRGVHDICSRYIGLQACSTYSQCRLRGECAHAVVGACVRYTEVLFGRKRWFLTPPGTKPDFSPDETSLVWVNRTYELYATRHSAMQECVLSRNEVLWIPDQWWHSTLNIGETVFISTFI